MENKKILIACPVSSFKEYIVFQWITYIKKLYAPFGYSLYYLVVDNSPNEVFSRKLKNTYIHVIYRKPLPTEAINETMAACVNVIRDYVVNNNFDYWFSLECDVFPPKNILLTLIRHNKPVVSACYNIGYGETRCLMLQYPVKRGDTMDMQNVTFIEGFRAITGKLITVLGAGMGCMLIKREVILDYTFHVDPKKTVHADSFFNVELYDRGFELWLDTSVFCNHYNSDWNKIKNKYDQRRNIR